MNSAKNKTDFMALSKIYKWYHDIFKLSFGWKKTVVQVFGVDDPQIEMQGITFGGCTLNYSEQFTHLGIETMNDPKMTQTKNVHN